MPLGFERLNERTQRPNANINFIKTVSTGADKAIAEEFLSRIAAQCYPVMKKHYITVMSLEEYPSNPEFLGRNFNAGEVIQLVLKDKQGRWLSFKFVQMVMMHELAHCKQMNHSRSFWSVRNEYAKHMEDLWKDRYEGEGLWGRGRGLAHGAFVHAQPPDNTQIPEHLCGGSYRRRGQKRKRAGQHEQGAGEKVSYAERQQKRIRRKLGKHGVSMKSEVLGDDELTRGALERMNGGKRAAGKPKVANSKRGRDLRANAALARVEALKQSTLAKPPELDNDVESETESEWEDGSASGSQGNAIIKDEHGHDMVNVCGEGEDDEEGAGKEMNELRMLSRGLSQNCSASTSGKPSSRRPVDAESRTQSEADADSSSKPREAVLKQELGCSSTCSERTAGAILQSKDQHNPLLIELSETEGALAGQSGKISPSAPPTAPSTAPGSTITDSWRRSSHPGDHQPIKNAISPETTEAPVSLAESVSDKMVTCSMCSTNNEPDAPTCVLCSHVLWARLMKGAWSCVSGICKNSSYLNPGDAGRCGACGCSRPQIESMSTVGQQ